MERELWRAVVSGLGRVPRRRPRNASYTNRQVLAVLLWAAMHDRPICWACERSSWPMQAWRRRLPDQSTMSRRLRDPQLGEDLRRLAEIVQRARGPASAVLLIDGKALEVGPHTSDPEAHNGRATGRYGRGYRLHALIDEARRLLAWCVTPMNKAESTVAGELVRRAPAGSVLYADASYDSNPLHRAAAAVGVRLVAPRRRPHMGIGVNQEHHPNRLAAIAFTEHDPAWKRIRASVRPTIECFFGAMVSVGGGLAALPAWARRQHRVEAWVDAKMVLIAARNAAYYKNGA